MAPHGAGGGALEAHHPAAVPGPRGRARQPHSQVDHAAAHRHAKHGPHPVEDGDAEPLGLDAAAVGLTEAQVPAPGEVLGALVHHPLLRRHDPQGAAERALVAGPRALRRHQRRARLPPGLALVGLARGARRGRGHLPRHGRAHRQLRLRRRGGPQRHPPPHPQRHAAPRAEPPRRRDLRLPRPRAGLSLHAHAAVVAADAGGLPGLGPAPGRGRPLPLAPAAAPGPRAGRPALRRLLLRGPREHPAARGGAVRTLRAAARHRGRLSRPHHGLARHLRQPPSCRCGNQPQPDSNGGDAACGTAAQLVAIPVAPTACHAPRRRRRRGPGDRREALDSRLPTLTTCPRRR
mmetsp:Transcript_36897/g.117420  ORF Transcript_36897/g.117420 Transcript_36897/m.117420 type:complete len:348 (-) Transcript_36897:88-1131(-)